MKKLIACTLLIGFACAAVCTLEDDHDVVSSSVEVSDAAVMPSTVTEIVFLAHGYEYCELVPLVRLEKQLPVKETCDGFPESVDHPPVI